MLTTYLNTLKTKGNFTFETIANLSGIPEATVKNIFSGKTETPRLETIAPIIFAMGGSLDAIYSPSKKDSFETNSIIAIKETYEQRIQETNEHYKQRISDLKEHYEERITEINEHIDTIKLDKRWFRISTCILCLALVVVLIVDVIAPGVGWFQY